MFIHVCIKHTVYIGYIANYLTKNNGLNLRFYTEKYNVHQTFNIAYNSAVNFIVQ